MFQDDRNREKVEENVKRHICTSVDSSGTLRLQDVETKTIDDFNG